MVNSVEAVKAPSPNQNEQSVKRILANNNSRSIYNSSLHLFKKLSKLYSTITFLQFCLKENITPPNFKIKNNLHRTTGESASKVNNILQKTSTSLIKVAIENLQKDDDNTYKQHLNIIKELLHTIPESSDQEAILEHLSKHEAVIRGKEIIKSHKKMSWLKSDQKAKRTSVKNQSPMPCDLDNCTSDKQPKQRRFIKRNKWKKVQDRKKNQPISVIYDYSTIQMTEGMNKILNRGLNFCINPLKLNITEILVDYRKFERKMKWKEFWSDQDQTDNNYKPELFPKEKSNLPPKTSKNLKTFITGVKSELLGTTFNKSKSNISAEESEALQTLIDLQKKRKIIIKPCDKGAGIIICDFDKYLDSCYQHLSSQITIENKVQPYYQKITLEDLNDAKIKIQDILKTGFQNNFISKSELDAMLPTEKGPGKFYQLFKVHKEHTKPNLPPGRPIISGCGSITENISLFVDHHSKHLVLNTPSYLQDTPDLLRQIEKMNETPLPAGAFAVSIDVVGLYQNIPHEEGISYFGEALNTRKDQTIPTDFLVALLRLVLTLNIFEFNSELFKQILGTAMGTRAAPTYANIFMSKIDILVKKCGIFNTINMIYFYKRFIDDILMIWTGTFDQFLNFMDTINQLHPSIKFTYNFNTESKSTTFLDTEIKIINNKISTDLYKKETDKIQYLLPTSCHPSHVCKNIPYSLALRLVRICSDHQNLLQRLNELKKMLISRQYNENIINSAIQRALSITRQDALKKVVKLKNERVTLAITYHPKLPSVSSIIHKHWKTMTKDPKMTLIFPKPPMVAFKQPPNLKKMLCHAKLPQNSTSKRQLTGMKKCHQDGCPTCPYILHSKEVQSSITKEKILLKGLFSCLTTGVIYIITCTKCNKQYVGQTGRQLNDRIKNHLYDICKKNPTSTGEHFNHHSHFDMKVQVIEKVIPNLPQFRLEREDYWIKKMATKTPQGLNKND